MKNIALLTIGTLVLAACSSPKAKPALSSATLEAISYQTQTMFNITCQKFDTYYADKWHLTVLDKPAQLDSLQQLLDGLTHADQGYEPNVRVKVLLTYTDGTADTVCLDDKITHYQGSNYNTSVQLANFVQR